MVCFAHGRVIAAWRVSFPYSVFEREEACFPEGIWQFPAWLEQVTVRLL